MLDPSILKTERPACHLISAELNPASGATLRAALSRESGFVLWPAAAVQVPLTFSSERFAHVLGTDMMRL